MVITGSSPAGISAFVILTGLDGTSTFLPIALPPSGPSQTIVVGVCVPVPSLPGPDLGGLGGLLNGLVNTVLNLLGGVPSLPGLPG